MKQVKFYQLRERPRESERKRSFKKSSGESSIEAGEILSIERKRESDRERGLEEFREKL